MSAGHDHGETALSDGKLVLAVAINMLLTLAQIVGGILSGSLALIADALHNFSDAGSLLIALVARRIGRQPPDRRMTYGYEMGEVVAALVNLVTLVVIGFYLVVEAIDRFSDPQPVEGWTVIWVAGIALVIDIATAVLVYRGSKESLNLKAAFLHNVSDALASVGVIAAGVLILLYDLVIVDLIVTVGIAAYVIWQGMALMPRTVRLLMGAVPDDIDLDAVEERLRQVAGVAAIRHLHIRSLSEKHRAAELHLAISDDDAQNRELTKRRVRSMLAEEFAITHATIETHAVVGDASVKDGCGNPNQGGKLH